MAATTPPAQQPLLLTPPKLYYRAIRPQSQALARKFHRIPARQYLDVEKPFAVFERERAWEL
jgi:hypothetical protein